MASATMRLGRLAARRARPHSAPDADKRRISIQVHWFAHARTWRQCRRDRRHQGSALQNHGEPQLHHARCVRGRGPRRDVHERLLRQQPGPQPAGTTSRSPSTACDLRCRFRIGRVRRQRRAARPAPRCTGTTPCASRRARRRWQARLTTYKGNLDLVRRGSVRNANADKSAWRDTPQAQRVIANHLGPRTEYLGSLGGNPAQALPVPEGGQVRSAFEISRFAHDDALVRPGKPGAAHLHRFCCNTDINAFSTYQNLKVGSTCGGFVTRRVRGPRQERESASARHALHQRPRRIAVTPCKASGCDVMSWARAGSRAGAACFGSRGAPASDPGRSASTCSIGSAAMVAACNRSFCACRATRHRQPGCAPRLRRAGCDAKRQFVPTIHGGDKSRGPAGNGCSCPTKFVFAG